MSDEKRQGKMRVIQALLDRASNTPFEEEANSARAKADQLMTEYVIESAELDAIKPRDQREGVEDRFMTVCRHDHVAKDGLMRLVSAVMVHCRVKALHYNYDGKYGDYQVRMWGFPSDLDYAEMLFTNLHLQLTKDMSPKPDPSQSFEENLVRLKESGMKWEDAHRVLLPDVPWERRHGVRYTGIYTKFCKDNGKERMYTSPQVFVRSFVDGFQNRVDKRLWELREQRKKAEASHGPGTDLVLADRYKQVDEVFSWVAKGGTIKVATKKVDWRAHSQGQAAGDRADLGQTRLGQKKAIR